MAEVKLSSIKLQSGTARSMYVTWTSTYKNVDCFEVRWQYRTKGDSTWFDGPGEDVTPEQAFNSLYDAPDNATKVRVKIKPVSLTYEKKGKQVSYWTGKWSSYVTYNFDTKPAEKPSSAPSIDISDTGVLTCEISNLTGILRVQFQAVQDDSSTYSTGVATVKTGTARWQVTVKDGSRYKVRYRVDNGAGYSEWSDYSANVTTVPQRPREIEELKALSKTSVRIGWTYVDTATSYEIQYTTEKDHFNYGDEPVGSTQTAQSVEYYTIIDGLETGNKYFFRVRAINDKGKSTCSGIKAITLGEPPDAPTTWASSTTVIVGEALNLYWVHNTVDGSSQVKGIVELTIGENTETVTVVNSTDEDEKDKTSVYSIDTSQYAEGTRILWRVKTCGITGQYGEWSVQRTIDIYARPSLSMVMNNIDGDVLDTLTRLPFNVLCVAGPDTQTPTGYHISVIANESYETEDNVGNTVMINSGESIYSKYFDTDEDLTLEISASDITLENGVSYTLTGVVSMNSGLTATSSIEFDVAFESEIPEPNAEVGYEEETISTFIRPYCEDDNGNIVENVTLAVYRREYDGRFVEIAKDIPNGEYVYVTDPHPALDYARYRIVAKSTVTGEVNYYDMPGEPIGEKAAIIQWDEVWKPFESDGADAPSEPTWSGSMLRLPYNIDVSDKNRPDVSLVKYVGRSHPVSYYGTHIDSVSTWNVVIPKSDEETIYALRRLAIWPGDVYVREPSGSGYWANITVSFDLKHRDVTVPVSFDITRVAGGV